MTWQEKEADKECYVKCLSNDNEWGEGEEFAQNPCRFDRAETTCREGREEGNKSHVLDEKNARGDDEVGM